MAKYYSRLADKGVNKRRDNMQFKWWFMPLLVLVLTALAVAADVTGIGSPLIILPAMIFMTMLIGSVAPAGLGFTVFVYSTLTPILTGVVLQHNTLTIAVTSLCLAYAAILCIPYRPFLWKNDAISLPLAVFIIFLNLAVTNTTYTVTLILTILLKSMITWLLCLAAIQLARTLLYNGRFLQWVIKKE